MITISVETDEEKAAVRALHEDDTLLRLFGDFSYAITQGQKWLAGGTVTTTVAHSGCAGSRSSSGGAG